MHALQRFLGFGLLMTCTSCAGIGLLYQKTTVPLDVNLNATPVQTKDEEGDVKQFRYYVSIDWDSNGIGDIAKQAGVSQVYYADYTSFSVVFGVWRQQFVTIYGR